MTFTADTPTSTNVAHDLPCAECFYNLRTLATGSRCPECGASIARSLAERQLCFASPKWVNRVRTGVILTFGHLLGNMTLTSLSVPRVVPVLTNALACVHILFNLAAIVGVWLITSPNPFIPVTVRASRIRTAARLAVGVTCTGRAMMCIANLGPAPALFKAGWAIGAALPLEFLFLALYIRVLARATPDRTLALHSAIAAAALPTFAIADLACQLFLMSDPAAYSTMLYLQFAAWLIFFFWSNALLHHAHYTLNKAHTAAQSYAKVTGESTRRNITA